MPPKRNASKASANASQPLSKKAKKDEHPEDAVSVEHIATNTTMPETFPDWRNEFPETHYKILSWNVSSLPASIKKGFHRYIESEDPDILCLQETKLNAPMHDLFPSSKYPYRYFCIGDKKGYSGSLIFSKIQPIECTQGFLKDGKDEEGRVLTLTFPNVHVINMYVPNAGENLKRLCFKMEWMKRAMDHFKHLETTAPIVICGDINVAHKSIDLAKPKTNTKTPGFTEEERAALTSWLEEGYMDVWRELHPKEQSFTYFSYRFNCRAKRIGWRLDYFLSSRKISHQLTACEIRDLCYGASDHVPIVLYAEKKLFDTVKDT